jgi:glycosyltransferase involved in cell wall biosynthesis
MTRGGAGPGRADAPARVALVAAHPVGSRGGNEATLRRLAAGLRARGVRVEIVRPGADAAAVARRLTADGSRPDLVHGLHARRGGVLARDVARRLGVPFVLHVTGTDASVDLVDPASSALVRSVVGDAAAVLCGNDEEVRRLGHPRALVLTKGVVVPVVAPEPTPPVRAGEVRALLVAHVRPVKNVGTAVGVARRLRGEGVPLALLVLGDVLNEAERARCVRLAGGEAAWRAVHRPGVPPERVGGWYAGADLVLNTSHAEGVANSVLEAMAHGRAVVASGVAGNEAVLGTDGSRGLLYPVTRGAGDDPVHDEEALAGHVAALAADADRRARLGDAARRHVVGHHTPAREIDELLRAYADARSA